MRYAAVELMLPAANLTVLGSASLAKSSQRGARVRAGIGRIPEIAEGKARSERASCDDGLMLIKSRQQP